MEPHLSPEALARLLAEDVTSEEEAAGEAHLRTCPECRARLDRLTAGAPALPSLFPPPIPQPTPPPAAPPGYEVLGQIAFGGTAVVYRARQPGLGREVAIKVLAAGWPTEEEARRRFRAEIEAAARQSHPGVVQVYEVGTHENRPYLVMEYCPGGSLAERLRAGPLPPRQAAQLIETLAHTLHAVHEAGLVHRDLKPANILFDGAGRPKVADFGVVKRLGAADAPTPLGSVLGTPPYLAPEQIDGGSAAGPRCDVYALGAILYECVAGRPPFRAENVADALFDVLTREPPPPQLFDPRLPRDLETVCLKCLEKEPARRYATARALADDLRRFLDGRPVTARRVGPAGRAWRWGRRNPVAALLATALAATVLAAVAACGRLWYDAVESGRQAEAARREAEENYRRTRELLPDLVAAGNGPWQQVAERRRARRESLERARGLYEELCLARPADRQLRAEFAEVVTALGEVAYAEGHYQAARDYAVEALGLWTGLRDGEPKESRWRERLAGTQTDLAKAEALLGHMGATIAALREATEVCQRLSDEAPDEAHRLLLTVGSRESLAGTLWGEGRVDESLHLSEEGRRQLLAYLGHGHDDPEVRLELVRVLSSLGERYQWRGNDGGAARCWREASRWGKALPEALPRSPEAWYLPTACAQRLPAGDPDGLPGEEAVPRLEQAVRLLEAALALDPESGGTTDLLARASRALAAGYLGLGRSADALRAGRRAADLMPSRGGRYPAPELDHLVGLACLARLERQAGDKGAALRRAGEVADGYEAFCTAHADDGRALALAADFVARLSPPLRHAGAPEPSRRVAERALRLAQQLAEPQPDAPALRRLSEAWTQLAKCRWDNDPAGTEHALSEAVAAARRFVTLVPEDSPLLEERLRRLVKFLSQRGRLAEAAACLHERERLCRDSADGLRGVAHDFRELAEDVGRGAAPRTPAGQEQRQHYLAEADRLEKAAAALAGQD
jgi:tetratricopeptide (TPR) repeat protein